MPDEHGQVPIRKSWLKKNPEFAPQQARGRQRVEIIKAEKYIGEKVSIRMDQPKEQPQLDVAPARIATDQWFSNLVTYDAHEMLLGGTGSGKSTLARALLAARAQTDAVVILDPHGRTDYNDPEQAHLNHWLGLVSVGAGRDFAAIETMVRTLDAEFQRRSVPGNKLGKPITVFVDEVPASVSNTDGVMQIGVGWIREVRKYGIRIMLLTTGKEVKALGIEGEGSIRDSLQTVLLGGFAKGVPGNEHAGQYAGAIVNGNTYSAKEDAHAIDTSGVPHLPVRQLDDSVLWQPDPALLASSSFLSRLLEDENGTSTKKKKQQATPDERAQILDTKARGGNKTEACREVYNGSSGGPAWYKVCEVWADADERC